MVVQGMGSPTKLTSEYTRKFKMNEMRNTNHEIVCPSSDIKFEEQQGSEMSAVRS